MEAESAHVVLFSDGDEKLVLCRSLAIEAASEVINHDDSDIHQNVISGYSGNDNEISIGYDLGDIKTAEKSFALHNYVVIIRKLIDELFIDVSKIETPEALLDEIIDKITKRDSFLTEQTMKTIRFRLHDIFDGVENIRKSNNRANFKVYTMCDADNYYSTNSSEKKLDSLIDNIITKIQSNISDQTAKISFVMDNKSKLTGPHFFSSNHQSIDLPLKEKDYSKLNDLVNQINSPFLISSNNGPELNIFQNGDAIQISSVIGVHVRDNLDILGSVIVMSSDPKPLTENDKNIIIDTVYSKLTSLKYLSMKENIGKDKLDELGLSGENILTKVFEDSILHLFNNSLNAVFNLHEYLPIESKESKQLLKILTQRIKNFREFDNSSQFIPETSIYNKIDANCVLATPDSITNFFNITELEKIPTPPQLKEIREKMLNHIHTIRKLLQKSEEEVMASIHKNTPLYWDEFLESLWKYFQNEDSQTDLLGDKPHPENEKHLLTITKRFFLKSYRLADYLENLIVRSFKIGLFPVEYDDHRFMFASHLDKPEQMVAFQNILSNDNFRKSTIEEKENEMQKIQPFDQLTTEGRLQAINKLSNVEIKFLNLRNLFNYDRTISNHFN